MRHATNRPHPCARTRHPADRSRRRRASQGGGTSLGEEPGVVLRASLLDRLFIEPLGHLLVREPVRELPKKLGAIQFRHRSGVRAHLSLSYENHVTNEKNQFLRVELTRSLRGHQSTNHSGRRFALNRCTGRALLRRRWYDRRWFVSATPTGCKRTSDQHQAHQDSWHSSPYTPDLKRRCGRGAGASMATGRRSSVVGGATLSGTDEMTGLWSAA